MGSEGVRLRLLGQDGPPLHAQGGREGVRQCLLLSPCVPGTMRGYGLQTLILPGGSRLGADMTEREPQLDGQVQLWQMLLEEKDEGQQDRRV